MTVSPWPLLQKDRPRVVIGPTCPLCWLKNKTGKLSAFPAKIDVMLLWDRKGLSALWRRKERLSFPSGPSFIPKTIVLTVNHEPATTWRPTGSKKCHWLQRLNKEINTTGLLLACKCKPILVSQQLPASLPLFVLDIRWGTPSNYKLPESPSNIFYLHCLCWQNRRERLFGELCASLKLPPSERCKMLDWTQRK